MITPMLVLNWLFQTLVAFVSTVAFSIIFHTPRREWIYTGITGAVGWLAYLISLELGASTAGASFFATVALTWFSRVFSFARKAPVTVFLICGIFPLVPGAGIYYTGYHFFMHDNTLAMSTGLETIKIAIAIALGIGIVLSMPQFFFTGKRAKKG